jgi:hypothetical protein
VYLRHQFALQVFMSKMDKGRSRDSFLWVSGRQRDSNQNSWYWLPPHMPP